MPEKTKKEILSKTKFEFYKELKKFQSEFKPSDEIEGFASSAIVGEKNYPNLKINNISNFNKENSFFNTSNIIKKDYSKIIKLKARNVLGTTNEIGRGDVRGKSRINEEMKNIYKSKKEIEFSSKFENELKFNKVLVNKVSGIMGSKNELISLTSNENISTSKQIEKYTQNDIKSKEAIINLYEKGVNEHQIINLFALGSFGIEINKKLVPSKWAISAYDQIIEKYLFKKIKEYKLIEDIEVYYMQDKGNYFLVCLFPHEISGETFEVMKDWSGSDYFNYENKLDKLEPKISGAYFSNKLAVFEHLEKRKRQASFLSIRIIKDYEIPLGVVFVRECVRECMKKRVRIMKIDRELERFLYENYKEFFEFYLKSKLRNEMKKIRKLNEFF